jgi:hypothetical protein
MWDMETRDLLEFSERYKGGSLCYLPEDIHILRHPVGKLQMMQDCGYLRFKSLSFESDRKEHQGMLMIESITLTPKGEALLREHTERTFLYRIKKSFGAITVAITTSILTVVVMKLLRLVK